MHLQIWFLNILNNHLTKINNSDIPNLLKLTLFVIQDDF